MSAFACWRQSRISPVRIGALADLPVLINQQLIRPRFRRNENGALARLS